VQYRPTYQLYGHIIGIYRRRVGKEGKEGGGGEEEKTKGRKRVKKEIVRKPR